MKDFKENRKLIGEGKMAKVYLYNDFAYKVFKKGYPKDWIDYEMSIQSEISKLHLPVVNYYESELENTIKMDYIKGITLADRIRKEKYKNGVEDLFSLFLEIHKLENVKIPRLKESLIRDISSFDFDEDRKKKALKFIDEIEDKNNLCHLDFHFLNIMYSNEEYKIVDWINSKVGNPIYDFARTYIIIFEFANRLSSKFLKLVEEQCNFTREELNKAIYVMAIHRLREVDSEKVRSLIDKLE